MALLSNATSDQIAFAAATDLEYASGDLTIWGWFKIADGFSSGGRLFMHGTSGAGGAIQLSVTDQGTQFTFDFFGDSGFASDPVRESGNLDYDVWYFLAATYTDADNTPRLFTGTESTAVSEDTTNSPTTAGLKAYGTGTVCEWLNYAGFNFCPEGAAIGAFGYVIGTAMSASALEDIRAEGGIPTTEPASSVIFCPDVNNTSTVTNDATSNVGDGTVTSLTVVADPSVGGGENTGETHRIYQFAVG